MMSLSKNDKVHLQSILSDLVKVSKQIEDARDQICNRYRTVGGEHFYAPLTELAVKLKKARSNLQNID